MKINQTTTYKAWEKVIQSQIASCSASIDCLASEIKATRRLRKCLKHTLTKGRKDADRT